MEDKIVEQFARKLASRSPLEVDDARQEVRMIVLEVTATYDASRGAWDHYLRKVLSTRTTNIIKRYATRNRAHGEYLRLHAVMYQPSCEAEVVDRLFIQEFRARLSEQARAVYDGMLAGKYQKQIGESLGLSQSRVAQIVRDIKQTAQASLS